MTLNRVLDYGEVLNVPQADERNRVVERKEVMLFDEGAFRLAAAIFSSRIRFLTAS